MAERRGSGDKWWIAETIEEAPEAIRELTNMLSALGVTKLIPGTFRAAVITVIVLVGILAGLSFGFFTVARLPKIGTVITIGFGFWAYVRAIRTGPRAAILPGIFATVALMLSWNHTSQLPTLFWQLLLRDLRNVWGLAGLWLPLLVVAAIWFTKNRK